MKNDIEAALDRPLAHLKITGLSAGYGPFLVLPLFGPSTIRDTAGIGVETVLDVNFWINNVSVRNTIFGVRSVDPKLFEAASMLGCRGNAQFYKVVLPAATPSIFTGSISKFKISPDRSTSTTMGSFSSQDETERCKSSIVVNAVPLVDSRKSLATSFPLAAAPFSTREM